MNSLLRSGLGEPSELVAMSLWNFLDEAVRPEESKAAADAGGEAFLFFGWERVGVGMQELSEALVSEASGGELTVRDGLEQSEVGRVADA